MEASTPVMSMVSGGAPATSGIGSVMSFLDTASKLAPIASQLIGGGGGAAVTPGGGAQILMDTGGYAPMQPYYEQSGGGSYGAGGRLTPEGGWAGSSASEEGGGAPGEQTSVLGPITVDSKKFAAAMPYIAAGVGAAAVTALLVWLASTRR